MAKSAYELVTQRIIEQLNEDIVPWQKPWRGTMGGAFNRVSGKAYSLINQMILKNDGEYAAFKQWSKEGGKIKKGEKSELVVFWKMYPIEEEKEDGTKRVKTIPLLKWYNVFHISQVEGVKPLEKDILKPAEPIAEAEKVKNEYILREKIKLLEK